MSKCVRLEIDDSRVRAFGAGYSAKSVSMYSSAEGEHHALDFCGEDGQKLEVWIDKACLHKLAEILRVRVSPVVQLTVDELAKQYPATDLFNASVKRVIADSRE